MRGIRGAARNAYIPIAQAAAHGKEIGFFGTRDSDMYSYTRVAPPNSLLVISDADGWTPPEFKRGELILSTSSCITIGCRMFVDGETLVVLGSAAEVDPGEPPAFEGMLETPNRKVVVSTVERETVLESRVPGIRAHVRIWVDHPKEPDKIVIGLT